MQTQSLVLTRCPSCGAGVPVAPHAAPCPFCGAEIAPHVSAHSLAQMPAEARAAEKEGREALEKALTLKFATGLVAGGAWYIAVVFGGLLYALFGFTIGAILSLGGYFNMFVGLSLAFVLFPGGLLGAFLFSSRRKRLRLAHAMSEIDAQLDASPQKAKCPACGGPVMIPRGTAFTACPFCTAPLLATHGMIVHFVSDARARAGAWHAQSVELVARARLSQLRQSFLMPLMMMIAMPTMVVLLGGLALALRSLFGMG